MGQVKSKVFTDKELNDYQDLTYLTKVEILRAYDRFNALCTEPDRYQKNPVVGVDEIMNIPELKVNPFRDRICSVFASDESYMSFEDFLDMISVFSDHASKAVKTEYAFRIYDFDEDDYVSQSDLKQVIERLVGNNELEDSDVQEIIDNIMAEADLDGDYILNFAEFEHVIAKLPDFEKFQMFPQIYVGMEKEVEEMRGDSILHFLREKLIQGLAPGTILLKVHSDTSRPRHP